MKAPQRVIDRALARIGKQPPSECWLWPGALFGTGYGHIAWSENGQAFHRSVHRVIYEALVGPIPEGMDLDHRCHAPATCQPRVARECPHRRCCNPAHLEPVDRRTNLLRGGTIPAARASITHCPQGHEYDEENTLVDGRGRRSCKACTYERNRAYYHANRERRKEYNRQWRAAKKGSGPQGPA